MSSKAGENVVIANDYHYMAFGKPKVSLRLNHNSAAGSRHAAIL